jgi:phosphoglycerol transferase MdoB-like AlkP superfamily enzyme
LLARNLGFDAFLGEEAFAGARRLRPFVSDIEIARIGAELLREEGPSLFLFAITVANHGPWLPHDPRGSGPHPAPDLPAVPEGGALKCFLNGLKDADRMLDLLMTALTAEGGDGVLAFYGDHLPSLPATFASLGFNERSTDYVIWRAGAGAGRRRDSPVHRLSQRLWAAMAGERSDGGRSPAAQKARDGGGVR